ncbi:hypothetical protein GCM10011487_26320 [Steroidobacter agaridevorans]|uniref:TonB-dependent receptor n=1 Tax=Steroidobacter agaridevorans TaxID=2695856 RepID=A0A829YDA6_9GAMM|nr:TonB-dependent receptor [Steroidobacter agaridevorans]GFE80632.1 hypothetical protein GCM10011487_26320 [Steroidobacter agaridevorans]
MIRNKKALKHAVGGAIVAGLTVSALPAARAQDAALPEAADSPVITEVFVTARRREESLQDVPLSIAAIGGEDLEQRNVTDLRQVNGQIPNVVIATSQFSGTVGSQFRMRGVPGVVVYQDGAPFEGGALPNLTDIERVEVLRGPQGTLFGRSAIGGAIQLVTRKPQDEFSLDMHTAFGSKNRVDVSGNLNVPITDELFVKLTAASMERDGYVSSTNVDTLFGSQDDKLGRLDVLWRPIKDFEVRAQYARTENKSSGVPYVNLNLLPVCNDGQAPANWFSGDGVQIFFAPNAYCLYTSVDLDPSTPGVQAFNDEFHSYGAQQRYLNTIDTADAGWRQTYDDVRVDMTWNLSSTMTVRALGSRRWGTGHSYEDLDGTGLDLWVNQLPFFTERNDLRTGELQFIYSGSRLNGTTGVYWEKAPGANGRRINWINNDLLQSPALAAAANAAYPGSAVNPLFGGHPESGPQLLGNGFIGISRTATEQFAAFSEWTVEVTEGLRLTGGLRYTEQDTTETSYKANPFGGDQSLHPVPALYQDLIPGADYYAGTGVPEVDKSTVTQWTPRFSLQYEFTPQIMMYATYSKGAGTGGTIVNVDEADPQIIALGLSDYQTLPEEVKNYELGLRSEFFGNTLRFNATVFYDEFANLELSEELVPGRLFDANADAEIKGVEIEGVWQATDALALNYGLGWIDAKYTDRGTTRNLEPGSALALTPEFSYALGAQYGWKLTSGELTLRGDYTWQDSQMSAVDRITAYEIPDFGLLSARLAYSPGGANWDVALSGTNLTGEYYIMSAFYQPQTTAVSATVGRPREIALSFNVRFE